MQPIIEQKIINQTDQALLIDVLHESTSLSKQMLKSALDKGCIWLKNGKKVNRVRRVKKPLKIGDEVYIYFNEKILSSSVTEPKLILDKRDYSVWFKPAGVFSQGSKWGDHTALTRIVEKILNRNCFLVHRLDRATSGLMIVAHTKNMAKELSNLFANRQIQKTYFAITSGDIRSNSFTIDNSLDGKKAISHIKVIKKKKDRVLLQVEIETGRKHQIRQHLSGIGCAIIGDRLYGNAPKNQKEDLQLQSVKLNFICPISKQTTTIELEKHKQLTI